MPKVLFFAEAVSLAHVARPVSLASRLGPEWDVQFACANEFDLCFEGSDAPRHIVESIAPSVFMKRLAQGAPLYSKEELLKYVAEDIRVIETVRPDVVVGDFRLSLSVAARVTGVPYAALCNAHWSPFAQIGPFPLPEIALERLLGPKIGLPIFRFGLPFAFRLHAAPLNAVRRANGLAPLRDLRAAYVDGDLTLYADTAGLVPTTGLPESHSYIGPVLWSPRMAVPEWWDALPQRRKAYVTVGSSGRAEALPVALKILEAAGFVTIVATAGRSDILPVAGQRFVARFLPGDDAVRTADIVVCNGGSATAYQALNAGKPVLGLSSNMDQFLTMQCIEKAGAGIGLRAARFTDSAFASGIARVRDDTTYKDAARRVQEEFAEVSGRNVFASALRRLVSE